MNKVSLTALAREHLEAARAASSGRSSHTVFGGHEHSLRQTLIALRLSERAGLEQQARRKAWTACYPACSVNASR